MCFCLFVSSDVLSSLFLPHFRTLSGLDGSFPVCRGTAWVCTSPSTCRTCCIFARPSWTRPGWALSRKSSAAWMTLPEVLQGFPWKIETGSWLNLASSKRALELCERSNSGPGSNIWPRPRECCAMRILCWWTSWSLALLNSLIPTRWLGRTPDPSGLRQRGGSMSSHIASLRSASPSTQHLPGSWRRYGWHSWHWLTCLWSHLKTTSLIQYIK